MTQGEAQGTLKRDAVGLWQIVFFVVAAASPLASMLGSVPPAFAFGNGVGVPSAYLIAGVILIIFSVGYARMSPFVRSAGAFFAFVSKGLGAESGCGAVALAMIGYHAIQCALYCLFGLFISDLVQSTFSMQTTWGWYASAAIILVAICGRLHVEFSSRILAALMLGEVLILFTLSMAIVLHRPAVHLTLHSFRPSVAFAPGLGISLAFAMSSFAGFEATTIFAEEARDPAKSIPRAAYLSIILIGLFYGFITWSAIQGYGEEAVVREALVHPDSFWFTLSDHYLGHGWTRAMNGLLLSSIFASVLAFHNTITRYFYALGRCGLLPRVLARVHPIHGSPHVATIAQTAIAIGVIAPFILVRSDPFRTVIPWTNATASIAMLLVEILVSVAIAGFFRRSGTIASLWVRIIAPLLATALLFTCLIYLLANLGHLSGTDSPAITLVPVGVAAVLLLGMGGGLWLRHKQPARFGRLKEYLQNEM
jgi:amino acid transporter